MFRTTLNALLDSGRVVAAMSGGVLLSAGVVGCANADQSCPSCSTTTKPAMMAHEMMSHTSGPFHGPKANTGTVTHRTVNGKQTLTVSDDFVIPDTPAPDLAGRRLQRQRLQPSAIQNQGQQVQPLDHFAGVHQRRREGAGLVRVRRNVLGEASFDAPVK